VGGDERERERERERGGADLDFFQREGEERELKGGGEKYWGDENKDANFFLVVCSVLGFIFLTRNIFWYLFIGSSFFWVLTVLLLSMLACLFWRDFYLPFEREIMK
jgi:hypothetical protein